MAATALHLVLAAALLGVTWPCAGLCRSRSDPFYLSGLEPDASHNKADVYGLRCQAVRKEDVPKLVTSIVSTSPRKEDASGIGLRSLQDTVTSITQVLGLAPEKLIVAFDGVPEESASMGVQALGQEAEAAYYKKLKDFKQWNAERYAGAIKLFLNKEWTHQAEMLHRVFDDLSANGTLKPLVYLAQDDSPVVGDIDVPFILRTLSCDPEVDLIRFLWSNDCTEGKAVHWNKPCTQHKDTPLLHKVRRFSDRPHFATVHYYYTRVFKHIPRFYRGAPERAVVWIRSGSGWIYGERYHMLHDTNELAASFNDFAGTWLKKNATSSS